MRLRGGICLARIWALRRALAEGRYDVGSRLEVVIGALLRELRARHAVRRGA